MIFTILIGLISCQIKQKEKEIPNKKTVSTYPSSSKGNSGFFVKQGSDVYSNNRIFLNICEYDKRINVPLLPKNELEYLEESLYISALYKLYHKTQDLNDNIAYLTYYEITNTSDWQSNKVSGKLYWLGRSKLGPLGNGSVYMSDTTEKYGWFIVLLPIEDEYRIDSKAYPDSLIKYVRIKSKHPKAEELYGNYERLSKNPYRLIRDEEVAKEGKIK